MNCLERTKTQHCTLIAIIIAHPHRIPAVYHKALVCVYLMYQGLCSRAEVAQEHEVSRGSARLAPDTLQPEGTYVHQ